MMNLRSPFTQALILLILAVPMATAQGTFHEVTYEPSEKPGELRYGVTYTVWIPDGVKTLRGVIVHQHGCGSGACKGGATASADLHWQALAAKWDCALLGPSYHQEDKQDCRLWCDPRNGSDKKFRQALGDLAVMSKHPELETAPWCLWGHSGGGFWASLMQTMHPERIVAIWFRSGTAFSTWEKGEIPKPEIPTAAYGIPMMMNPGGKEKDDKRFAGAWTGSMAMFTAYRAKGAPVAFAADPKTSHECGDSRYLAIPFFDACLAMRLPKPGNASQQLLPVDQKLGWLAPILGDKAEPAAKFTGKPEEANWLPNEAVAKAWAEYVKTGATTDTTPPPTPTDLKVTMTPDGPMLTWKAAADFESGLQGFLIEREGADAIAYPAKPVGRFGRPLFQTMSYHDTPEKPVPELKFTDKTSNGIKRGYRITAINSVGLKSKPTDWVEAK
ncbi:hypothetical protein [Zavarzinella formosa]|uniref:hypothetical protein n=1 Tax=Zavarzinella formosa TaxID=360055 RepID=UPI000316A342|nr:hypothetical protein [Zavarzinella formosa]